MRHPALLTVLVLSLTPVPPAQTQTPPREQAKVPLITTMADDALVATLPEDDRAGRNYSLYLGGAQARFSPDGNFLALVPVGAGVWLYDMNSRQMVSVITVPHEGMSDAEFEIRDVAWAADDTLYIRTEKPPLNGRPPLIAATMTGTKEIAEFPAPIAALFQRQAASLPYARPNDGREESDDQYAVRSSNPDHGAVTLTMYPKNGSAPKVIANGSYELQSFLLDSVRSLVIYPVRVQLPSVTAVPPGIVIFDLNTQQSREIALPNRPEQLLAQTRDGTGYLVAYVVIGDCVDAVTLRPPLTSSRADFMLYMKAKRSIPSHVCFVKLP